MVPRGGTVGLQMDFLLLHLHTTNFTGNSRQSSASYLFLLLLLTFHLVFQSGELSTDSRQSSGSYLLLVTYLVNNTLLQELLNTTTKMFSQINDKMYTLVNQLCPETVNLDLHPTSRIEPTINLVSPTLNKVNLNTDVFFNNVKQKNKKNKKSKKNNKNIKTEKKDKNQLKKRKKITKRKKFVRNTKRRNSKKRSTPVMLNRLLFWLILSVESKTIPVGRISRNFSSEEVTLHKLVNTYIDGTTNYKSTHKIRTRKSLAAELLPHGWIQSLYKDTGNFSLKQNQE